MVVNSIVYNIVVVGAGGTGSHFIARLAQFVSSLDFEKCHIRAVRLGIVDGDTVEQKNLERQNFCSEDFLQNKAEVLARDVEEVYPREDFSVAAFAQYVNEVDDLCDIFSSLSASYINKNTVTLLIGCCDNHRCRQVMEKFFDSQKDIIYLDAANEFSVGEVVIGIRTGGKLLSPSRKYYFPDIMTDRGKSRAEESCGAINISAPQHLATNVESANVLLSMVSRFMSSGQIDGGIIYFDTFGFSKVFRKYKSEGSLKKAAGGGKNEKFLS